MNIHEIAEQFPDYDLYLMDGYDDQIIGIIWLVGLDHPTIVYSRERIIDKMMNEDGMTFEEAEEYHEFNQAQAYIGPGGPTFI